MTIACLRRLLFVMTLLLIGPLTISVFHYLQSPAGLTPLIVAVWGFDSIGIAMSLWLAARANLWKSWSGPLRAMLYLLAFAYGRMLFDTTQTAWTNPKEAFRFPGALHDDYARPALDLSSIIPEVLICLPLVKVLGISLSSSADVGRPNRQVNLAFLLSYVTAAAVALMCVRFLASPLAPRTFYSGMEQAMLYKLFAIYGLMSLAQVLAVVVLLLAFSKSGYWSWLALPVAFAIDLAGTKLLIYLANRSVSGDFGGIVGVGMALPAAYVFGRVLLMWSGIGIARWLGVLPVWIKLEDHSKVVT